MAVLTACGDKNKAPTKKERVNTAEIVNVYQTGDAIVYAEVKGFEHTDWEYISNSGYNAYTLEFSINDGEWFYMNLVQDYYDEYGIGIYSILSTNYQYGEKEITSYNVLLTGQTVSPGEISISVRIPESDKYYASAGSEKQNYTLKKYIQNSLDVKFISGIYSLGSLTPDTKEERYAFYQDSANPYNIKIGKFYSEENEKGGFDSILRALSEDEEATLLAELNLEYKVVNFTSKYITSHEGNESINTLSIQSDENDVVYNTKYWTSELNLKPTNIWRYQNDGWEIESVVFLVRQKADDNTVQSFADCYEVEISREEILEQTN